MGRESASSFTIACVLPKSSGNRVRGCEPCSGLPTCVSVAATPMSHTLLKPRTNQAPRLPEPHLLKPGIEPPQDHTFPQCPRTDFQCIHLQRPHRGLGDQRTRHDLPCPVAADAFEFGTIGRGHP